MHLSPEPTAPAPLPIPGPLSLGELLDRAFRLYRLRFRSFLTIAALFLVPYAVASGLVTGQFLSSYYALFMQVASSNAELSSDLTQRILRGAGTFGGLTILVSLAGIVLMLLNSLALTSHAIAALYGQPEPVGASVRRARRRFWPALRMNLLKWLVLAGIALALVVAGVIVGFLAAAAAGGAISFVAPQGSNSGVLASVGIMLLLMCGYLIGMLLLAVPVVYLMGRWQVALPGIVDQGWRARQSLAEAWRLSQGHTWRVVGYLVLLWALSAVITSVPLYLVQYISLFAFSDPQMFLVASAVSSVFATLLSVLWQPLAAIAVALLYFDLRVRQEGLDIERRVAAMEAALGVPPLPLPEGAGDASL
jgi:hypothetical protein